MPRASSLSQWRKRVWGKEPAGHPRLNRGHEGCFLSQSPGHKAHAPPQMTGTHQAKPASWAESVVPSGPQTILLESLPITQEQSPEQLGKAMDHSPGAPGGTRPWGSSKTSQSACPSLHRWLSSQLCHTLPKPPSFLDGSQRVFQLPFQCLPVSGLGSQTASSPKTRSVATVCAIPCAWRRGDRCSLNVWTCNVFNKWWSQKQY